MELSPALEPFVREAPLTVMVRAALEWLVDDAVLDELFDRTAEAQYTRRLTLGHLVDVLLDVAAGVRPSPRAAYRARGLDRLATEQAFYGKLSRTEPGLAAAVVAHTADRAREAIIAAGGAGDEPIPGYAARILDGNALAGSEHRLGPLRRTRAAGLPGKLLAVFEPAAGLVTQYVPCEDAYTQERAPLDRVAIASGELWIADRNFCVRGFLGRIAASDASFLVRRHGSGPPLRARGERRPCGRVETGAVFEQDVAAEGLPPLRRIVLELDRPTSDGDAAIELLTDLPAAVPAGVCCMAYRDRWRIERHFQKLTDLLHCEQPRSGHPRAALFAFAMALVASHALGQVESSLRATHGAEPVEELSWYQVVDEISHTHRGLMIAAPAVQWEPLRQLDAASLASLLNTMAAAVPIDRMRRVRRGPKKPRNTPKGRHTHRSTRRLLDEDHARRNHVLE